VAALYKPGPQARYLVEKMAESKKAVVEALSALIEKLASLEKRVDSYGGDLKRVQAKVDLVMQFISMVQQEKITVAKHLKLQSRTISTPSPGDDMMGPGPGTTPSSLAGPQQPPPPPSDNLLRHHQVHNLHPHTSPHASEMAPLIQSIGIIGFRR
jgi:hypothetical protein